MADKIGVYLCEGCGVGKAVDLGAVQSMVKKVYGAACPVVETKAVLCSPESAAEIKTDIEESGLKGVCVCACSPRSKWDVFNFDGVLVERVNLREHAVWSFDETGDGVPNKLATIVEDYVKMGVTKLKNMTFPELEVPEMSSTILVVGGGWTGLNAALDAAKAGFEVVLIEKTGELGGYAAKMYKTVPLAAPYDKAHPTGVEKLIAEVKANGKITVKTTTTVKTLAGAPGMYDCTFQTSGGEETMKIGSVVLAAGFVMEDTAMLEPLGFGKIANVVTAHQFEEMAKAGKIVKPSDGKPAKKVAFIVNTAMVEPTDAYPEFCPVDGKDEEKKEGEEAAPLQQDLESPRHLSISIAVSTMTALKQAGYVTEKYGDGIAYIVYDHMIVPGIHEKFYKAAQDAPGVMMTKADVASIADGAGQVLVNLKNTLLGDDIEIGVDLVVLPTGIVPATAKDPILNFVYRQGPAIPELGLFEGFADSNYICFPYETRRTGVYAAGCVRSPMLMDQAATDAAGAALKAVQCQSAANRGVAVHPRSGDKSYPVFNFVRCTQCKRCTEECPFGALDDDAKGTPLPNPTRCRRCGTCMGACPERVISFDTYGVGMLSDMIKQYSVPDDIKKGGPRILVLACENDAYPAVDMAAVRGKAWSPYVRIMPVRCLGSVNAIWIKDAMSRGTDGVMLLGCKFGNDYQCHFVKGSEICNRRMANIAETLKQLGIQPERVEQFEIAIDEYDKVPTVIEKFVNSIMAMGPNPFKGY